MLLGHTDPLEKTLQTKFPFCAPWDQLPVLDLEVSKHKLCDPNIWTRKKIWQTIRKNLKKFLKNES